jgi:predicted aldo/keto reductase-like oxidoreductase
MTADGFARSSGRTLDDTSAGTIALAGKSVRRLGFGAMRVSAARNAEGRRDRAEAVKLYRRVYERGVNFIDVCSSGPRPGSDPASLRRGRDPSRRSVVLST